MAGASPIEEPTVPEGSNCVCCQLACSKATHRVSYESLEATNLGSYHTFSRGHFTSLSSRSSPSLIFVVTSVNSNWYTRPVAQGRHSVLARSCVVAFHRHCRSKPSLLLLYNSPLHSGVLRFHNESQYNDLSKVNLSVIKSAVNSLRTSGLKALFVSS